MNLGRYNPPLLIKSSSLRFPKILLGTILGESSGFHLCTVKYSLFVLQQLLPLQGCKMEGGLLFPSFQLWWLPVLRGFFISSEHYSEVRTFYLLADSLVHQSNYPKALGLTVNLGFLVIQFGGWSGASVGFFIESRSINMLAVTNGIHHRCSCCCSGRACAWGIQATQRLPRVLP